MLLADDTAVARVRRVIEELPALSDVDAGAAELSTEQARLLRWLQLRCLLTLVSSSTVGSVNVHSFFLDGGTSPRFADLAARGGTEIAFHGTAPDSAWAILNGGLRNMSGTAQAKHGAAFGDGLYLARSREVALHFARSTSHAKRRLWPRSSLDAALGSSTRGGKGEHTGSKGSWAVIFRCEVVRGSRLPPVASSSRTAPAVAAQQGDYFLVTDDTGVRVVGLELWVDCCRSGGGSAAAASFLRRAGTRLVRPQAAMMTLGAIVVAVVVAVWQIRQA